MDSLFRLWNIILHTGKKAGASLHPSPPPSFIEQKFQTSCTQFQCRFLWEILSLDSPSHVLKSLLPMYENLSFPCKYESCWIADTEVPEVTFVLSLLYTHYVLWYYTHALHMILHTYCIWFDTHITYVIIITHTLNMIFFVLHIT